MIKLFEKFINWFNSPSKYNYKSAYLVTSQKLYDKWMKLGYVECPTGCTILFNQFASALAYTDERPEREFIIMRFTLPTEMLHNEVADIFEVNEPIEIDEFWTGTFNA